MMPHWSDLATEVGPDQGPIVIHAVFDSAHNTEGTLQLTFVPNVIL